MSEYVKFKYGRASEEIAPFDELAQLNECRRKLLELKLIGVRSNGVSFGNLSVRDGVTDNFYVTGSATGALSELTLADCVKVLAYDFKRNWLRYEGAAIPSSESLTHAAVYKSDGSARAVIHCHDSSLWLTFSIEFQQLQRPLSTAHQKWPAKSKKALRDSGTRRRHCDVWQRS